MTSHKERMYLMHGTQTQLNDTGGFKKMSKIDKGEYEFAETLKPADIKKDIETTITGDKTIGTKFGEKRVIFVAEKDKDGKDKQVFINAFSLKNLVEAYGEETDDWKDKPIVITTETSERTQGKKSIVIKKK